MSSESRETPAHYVDVMIDLETLGLRPGYQILSIGAVSFNLGCKETFYQNIERDYRFKTDPKTVAWWNEQTEESHAAAFAVGELTEDVLNRFIEYLSQLESLYGYPVRVWGNAASMDIKMLEAAYEICSISVPWKYYNEMCYRTLKNLVPSLLPPTPTIKHHALEDAKVQAIHAEQLFKLLGVPY